MAGFGGSIKLTGESEYKKALKAVNEQLASRSEAEKQKVQTEQSKINEKKLKQANSKFKGMNPWNSSYTTLLLHKQ